jgi:phospholipase/carboxylesterase
MEAIEISAQGLQWFMDTKDPEAWENSFIHRFVFGSSDSPTLLLMHGTGGNEDSLLDLGAELMPGANLLSPRGKVLEHGMPRFFRRLAEGVFDEEDLHARTGQLAAFIREALTRYNLKQKSLLAAGYSNGANILASLVLSDPGLLAGAVLLRGMPPFDPQYVVDVPGTPVLLLNGERDPVVSTSKARHLAKILTDAGAKVDQRFFDAGHSMLEIELDIAQNFLQTLTTQV